MARPDSFTAEDETPLPDGREGESLLAFQFDERGIPQFIAEFESKADKLVLLYFGQAVIAEIGRAAVKSIEARSGAPRTPLKKQV
jgi:hypothetical protein